MKTLRAAFLLTALILLIAAGSSPSAAQTSQRLAVPSPTPSWSWSDPTITDCSDMAKTACYMWVDCVLRSWPSTSLAELKPDLAPPPACRRQRTRGL